MTITAGNLLNIQDTIIAVQLLLSGKMDKPLAELREAYEKENTASRAEMARFEAESMARIAEVRKEAEGLAEDTRNATARLEAEDRRIQAANVELLKAQAELAEAKEAFEAANVAVAEANAVREVHFGQRQSAIESAELANQVEAGRLAEMRKDLEARLAAIKAAAGV